MGRSPWDQANSGWGRGVRAGVLRGAGKAVQAPVEAEPTAAAYLANAPRVSVARGDVHSRPRESTGAFVDMVRVSTSMTMRSPSRSRPIGPPSAASGHT